MPAPKSQHLTQLMNLLSITQTMNSGPVHLNYEYVYSPCSYTFYYVSSYGRNRFTIFCIINHHIFLEDITGGWQGMGTFQSRMYM